MSVPHPSEMSSMRRAPPRTAVQAQFRPSDAFGRSASPPRTASDFPNFEMGTRRQPFTSADYEAQMMRHNPYTAASFNPMLGQRPAVSPRTASPYDMPRTASHYDMPRTASPYAGSPRTASLYDMPRTASPFEIPRTANHYDTSRAAVMARTASQRPMTRSQFPQPVFSAYR
jgi:hypothetical protein